MIRALAILAFSGLLMFASCSKQESVCLQSKSNPCILTFHTYLTDTSGALKKTALELQSVSCYLITESGLDTLYQNRTLSQARIPLNPNQNYLKVLFRADSTQSLPDTIFFDYQRSDIFVNQACGMAQTYSLDTVYSDRQLIDSMLIVNPSLILNNSDVNVQIIF